MKNFIAIAKEANTMLLTYGTSLPKKRSILKREAVYLLLELYQLD